MGSITFLVSKNIIKGSTRVL